MARCGCEETFFYFSTSWMFSHSKQKLCERAEEPNHLPPLPRLECIESFDDFEENLPEDGAEDCLELIASRKEKAYERIKLLKNERNKAYQKAYGIADRGRPGSRAKRRVYEQAWREKHRDELRARGKVWRDAHCPQLRASQKVQNDKRRRRTLENKAKDAELEAVVNEMAEDEDLPRTSIPGDNSSDEASSSKASSNKASSDEDSSDTDSSEASSLE